MSTPTNPHAAAVHSTAALAAAQTAHARELRLRNLERREPMVRDLRRDQHALETRLAASDARRAILAEDVSRLQAEVAELRSIHEKDTAENSALRAQLDEAREKLAAALKPKRGS